MNSMTGFGRGEASGEGVTVTVEMKSVNNRFRDLQLRCPREYMAFEPRIATALKPRFGRGRIDVFVRRVARQGGMGVMVDKAMAETYHSSLSELARSLGVEAEVDLAFLAGLPGVLVTVEQVLDVTGEWHVLETALIAAAKHLTEMREKEGEAMRRVLTDLVGEIDDLRQKVALEADGVAARLRLRLMDRLNKLVGDRVDPDRLAQEAAVLADKADVAEELARLQSHNKQFLAALGRPEPIGRRLDFLAQEMNREINTIGSKAAEHAVSALVVDMKSTLERIREQVANVE
ncbi:MAG TPA: YicC/YloC family endoribonuclease [Myxococcota bacterium]|nr:YicC/YloC family endoribonuclease [Myxococcota bacterium]